jgi:probable rRNA maturation factor
LNKTRMAISFYNADVRFVLKQKQKLKKFIANQLKANGRAKFSIRIIFCSDEYLLDINRKFLNHDYYTDIITFPLTDGENLEAELYISIDRVADNAVKTKIGTNKGTFKTSQQIDNEANRVIFHGILHLLGFNDKTANEKRQMRIAEDKLLKGLQKFEA